MAIGELSIRDVVTASRGTSVSEASKLMRRHHVGDIVVIEERNGRIVPVGVVTDRDLVLEVLAQDLDARTLTVGDLLTHDLITINQAEGYFRAIELMKSRGIRRVPVVDNQGGLIGIVCLDDMIELLGDELSLLGKAVTRDRQREVQARA